MSDSSTDGIPEIFDIDVPEISEIPTVEKPCVLCARRDTHAVNTFVLCGQRFHTVRCWHDGMMWVEQEKLTSRGCLTSTIPLLGDNYFSRSASQFSGLRSTPFL